MKIIKSKCLPKSTCTIMKQELFSLFRDEVTMCKQMQKSNFIFKTAWNFLADIKNRKVQYGLNLLFDFEQQIS